MFYLENDAFNYYAAKDYLQERSLTIGMVDPNSINKGVSDQV